MAALSLCTWLSSSVAVVQSLSHVWLIASPWTRAHQAPLFSTVSQSLLKFTSMKPVMVSSHLILYHPLLLLPSIFFTIRVFSNELALSISWPKYWSFSFSKALPVKFQGWFPLGLISLIPCSPRDSQVLSSTTIQKPQFFSAWPSLWFNSHIHTRPLEKP